MTQDHVVTAPSRAHGTPFRLDEATIAELHAAILPIDYCVELAEGRVPPPANLDIGSIQEQELAMAFRFHVPQYLTRRAADWKAQGFTETLVDFAALNARSRFWGDDARAAFKNWEEVKDPRNPHGERQGVNERIMLRELLPAWT